MPDTLPFAPVARLPPSASFYSAITQPLGLKYITADPTHIVFGVTSSPTPTPVFEVKCTPDGTQPSKHSRIVFSAWSPSVVSDFCAAALRTNPVLHIASNCSYIRRRYISSPPTPPTPPLPASFAVSEEHQCSTCSAKIIDLDGNIMEVAHIPEQNDCSKEEASRILDWNWDVATNYTATEAAGDAVAVARRPSRESDDGTQTIYRRMITTTTRTTTTVPPPAPAKENGGLSTGAVIGGVLGAVAAGAAIGGALTYTMMNRERDRAPQQEYDVPRRSSAPNPFPPHNGQRFIEVERTTEKIRYPEDYAQMRRYPPPSYVARYAQGGRPMSRALEDVDERMSRSGSQHTSRTRPRGSSEVSASRRPLMLTDTEHRSNAGSKYTGELGMIMNRAGSKAGTSAPKSQVMADNKSHAPTRVSAAPSKHAAAPSAAPSKHSAAPSRHTGAASRPGDDDDDGRSHATTRRQNHRPPEAETFVSARTGKSAASTVRAPPTVVPKPAPARSVAPSRAPSKATSRHTSATAKGTGASKAASRVSTRDIPPPASHVGSQAELDDDLQSLAPSDSISCVGSRQRDR